MGGYTFTISNTFLAVLIVVSAAEVSFPDDSSGTSDSRNTVFENTTTSGRRAKDLFGWLDFNSFGRDPFLDKSYKQCLDSDILGCLKYRAVKYVSDVFPDTSYNIADHVSLVKVPVRNDGHYEFASAPRSEDSDWDSTIKYVFRKSEDFFRGHGVTIDLPAEVTNNGRDSPRFIDEIATEIDVLEDKNESDHAKTKLKKLFIPLLIILKLFKLKLLLLLPFILGLFSFKKIIGFLVLAVPGIIGFFKLCRPELQNSYGNFGHSSFYQPPYQGSHGGYGYEKYDQTGGYSSQYNTRTEGPNTNRNPWSSHQQAYSGYYQQHQQQ